MPFGAQIFNSGGAAVFDGQGCMYERATGVTSVIPRMDDGRERYRSIIETQRVGRASVYGALLQQNGSDHSLVPQMYHHIGNSYHNFAAWFDSYTYSVTNNPLAWGEIAFVQIPSEGILQMCHINNKLPEAGSGANLIVTSIRSVGIGYKIFSPDVTGGIGTYGMQIFNESGQLTFDSRRRILGMEVIDVTAAQAQDILTNNATINFTLSKPTPGAFISSPMWMSYAGGHANEYKHFIKITQPDASTIRLTRARYGINTNPSGTPYSVNRYMDMKILVTRDA